MYGSSAVHSEMRPWCYIQTMNYIFNVQFIYKAHINTTNVDNSAVHRKRQNKLDFTLNLIVIKQTITQILGGAVIQTHFTTNETTN